MSSLIEDIMPVFFYSQVLTCGEEVQFHFHEPRYRLMMRRVWDGCRHFAYCHIGHRLRQLGMSGLDGATALLLKVVTAEFFPDGRCLVKAVCVFPRRKIVSCYGQYPAVCGCGV